MSDSQKYYYLKLKENFYDSEEMIVLQNMQDGYLYSDILIKLYLRSLKSEGRLMFKDLIPYTPQVLAQVVRHQVGTVEKALNIFKEIGLVEILDNGAIYMSDIQNFIGQSSTEADRKREYRAKIDKEVNKMLSEGQNSDKCPDKSPPEIDIDIELEKEIDIELKKKPKKERYGEYKNVSLTQNEYDKLQKDYPNCEELITYLDEYIEMKGYKAKSHYLCIKKWVVDAVKQMNKNKRTCRSGNIFLDMLKEEGKYNG